MHKISIMTRAGVLLLRNSFQEEEEEEEDDDEGKNFQYWNILLIKISNDLSIT